MHAREIKNQATNYWRQAAMSNGWTFERRQRQALAIRRWQPWARSTGPRSANGKAKAAGNSFKHGAYSRVSMIIAREFRNLGQKIMLEG